MYQKKRKVYTSHQRDVGGSTGVMVECFFLTNQTRRDNDNIIIHVITIIITMIMILISNYNTTSDENNNNNGGFSYKAFSLRCSKQYSISLPWLLDSNSHF